MVTKCDGDRFVAHKFTKAEEKSRVLQIPAQAHLVRMHQREYVVTETVALTLVCSMR